MSSHFGENFSLTVFGEAEAGGVGLVLEGLPVGLVLDEEIISKTVGPYKIISGMHNGKATGAPLTALFPTPAVPDNEAELSPAVLRPGFADIGQYKRAGGKPELLGGGHLAEQAVPSVLFAGAVAQQLLQSKKIKLYSHIFSIGEVQDTSFDSLPDIEQTLQKGIKGDLPVLDKRKEMLMKVKLAQTEAAGDTIGGQIECMILGLPAGIGEPIFGGLKTKIASLLFSLPRVTAVEFGIGTAGALMNGSAYNDLPFVDTLKGQISTRTNHCGGIEGGISNGMPVITRISFAPAPAIAQKQPTVHRSEQRDMTLPPFIAPDACDMAAMCRLVQAALSIIIVDTLS